MSAKEIITKFFELDFVKDEDILSYFHDDCQVHWSNSKGFIQHSKSDIENLLNELKRNYHSYQAETFQILEDNNTVTVRYTIYVTPIERPEKEDALADFISIYEIKDQKIYRCYQISNLVDNNNVGRIEKQ